MERTTTSDSTQDDRERDEHHERDPQPQVVVGLVDLGRRVQREQLRRRATRRAGRATRSGSRCRRCWRRPRRGRASPARRPAARRPGARSGRRPRSPTVTSWSPACSVSRSAALRVEREARDRRGRWLACRRPRHLDAWRGRTGRGAARPPAAGPRRRSSADGQALRACRVLSRREAVEAAGLPSRSACCTVGAAGREERRGAQGEAGLLLVGRPGGGQRARQLAVDPGRTVLAGKPTEPRILLPRRGTTVSRKKKIRSLCLKLKVSASGRYSVGKPF